jgi:glycosyltransferase involved in cell wall biosynthesis
MGKLRIAVSNKIIGVGLRSGGVTIVNSEYLKAESRRDFGIEAEIVRMGGMFSPDSDALASAHAARRVVRGGPLSMLSVCRIEPNKRIDWLLRALAVAEKTVVAPLSGPLSSVVDWQLELAGKGSKLEELKALAETLGIGDRVHFHGFVSDEALGGLYASADVFLMPAVQGYGIPALEAIERGIPVLLHRESGISDMLLDTPWAVVLEGGEENLPGAIARAVESVLEGRQRGVEPPRLATEDEWAERVAGVCGWL